MSMFIGINNDEKLTMSNSLQLVIVIIPGDT